MNFNFDYITNYIIEYDTGVPNTIIMGILVIIFVTMIVLSLISANGKVFIRNSAWCMLIGYLFLTICATIIYREVSETYRCSFYPFLNYTELYDEMLAQIILNVVMFIPIGFLLGIAVRNTNTLKVLGIGCMLSLTIEIIQLVSRRGVFNIDDVIHNTLGCAIGFGIFKLGCALRTAYIK